MIEEDESRSKRKRDVNEEVSFDALVSPNFEELSRRFPDFGRAYSHVQQIQREQGGPLASHMTQDFSIALTKALLHLHWGLSLTHLPDHHLCPPVPNRYFYVQWIQQDLLPLLSSEKHFVRTRSLSRVGLDIGTGATCIYLLLFAASTNVPWTLYGTEIDPESLRLAQQNVQSNKHLQSLIHLFLVAPTDAQEKSHCGNRQVPAGPLRRAQECLVLHNHRHHAALDFCMTNPPFYDDTVSSERTDRRHGDGRDRTCMTVSEGSYPGGEVGFVLDMIVDGLYFFGRQQEQQQPTLPEQQHSHYNCMTPGWTLCMCGKKTSWIKLKHVVTELLGPAHVCCTEFTPGHLTRWFLAWTFEQPQIRSPLAQTEHWEFTVTTLSSTAQVVKRIQDYCESLPGWRLLTMVKDDGACIEIQEAEPLATTLWADEQLLPEQIQTALAQMDPAIFLKFLPPQGHFLIDCKLMTVDVEQRQQQQQQQQAAVHVSMEAFMHSTHGRKAVEKIKNQVQGEICRTNRRWRRKLTRESAMDES